MARKHSRRGNKHSIKRAHRRSSRVKRQSGGYGPGAGPVGAPWQADPNTWPGMAALDGADTQGVVYGNHLPLSPNGIAVGGVMPAEPEVLCRSRVPFCILL